MVSRRSPPVRNRPSDDLDRWWRGYTCQRPTEATDNVFRLGVLWGHNDDNKVAASSTVYRRPPPPPPSPRPSVFLGYELRGTQSWPSNPPSAKPSLWVDPVGGPLEAAHHLDAASLQGDITPMWDDE